MFEALKEDIKVNDRRLTPIIILMFYRSANSLYYSNIPKSIKKVPLILLKILQKVFADVIFGVEIPYKAKIAKGLRIVHPKDIVIAEAAIIGEHCTIFNQTTIGVNEHKEINKAPKIGNYVYIAAGGKVIGNIAIGDNCRIGANAVITKSIKNNTTVVCVQRIIER